MTRNAPPMPARPARRRIGVIDIGSNSIRLVVYGELTRAPIAIFNEKVLCGLGRTVERTGRLSPDGVRLALDNLARFHRLADGMEVGRLDVLATAAVRDAADGAHFVAEAGRRTGLSIQIISGEEEARLSALGVVSGMPEADGMMGDLGGGSLELVGLDRGSIGPQTTLPLGPLRLMETSGGRAAVAQVIDRHLGRLGWLGFYAGRTFYPVGGSWRTMAKIHMEQDAHPLHVIDHYGIDAGEATEFAALLARQSRSSLEKMSGGARRRIDSLPYAALVLERVLRAAKPKRVVFSAFGLREGHLFDLLSPEQQRLDPLLSACAGVAARVGRFREDDESLFAWIAPLFPDEDAGSARLRRAACLLSDLGWAEHPDYRAEHAYLRTLRMPVAGVDHHQRAFLALVLYARYAGRFDDAATAVARGLVDDGAALKAQVLGLTLRLARTLTGGVDALLQHTALRLTGSRVELTLLPAAAMLNGDAVARRVDAVAKLLGRNGAVVVSQRSTAPAG